MFTVCPKCALTLAVAAADLRAGQGYVRCGRCANVFNALLGLSDDSGTSTTVHGPTVRQERRQETRREEDPALHPALMQASPPQLRARPFAPLARPAPAALSTPSRSPPATPRERLDLEVEEFRGTGTFETIVLEGDSFLHAEEQVAEEDVDIELADVSRRIEAARDSGDLARFAPPPPADKEKEAKDEPSELAAEEETAEEEVEEEEEEGEPDEDAEDVAEELRAPRARAGWLGISAAVLLVLALGAQAIHHWRNDLVTYGAWFGPLERLYTAVGEPLQPNWDLDAYEVRQLGASSDVADPRSLKVRLSLSNRGDRPQALPLLRLSLLDRYGNVVSSGELKAEEYLPAALRGLHFLAREQRIDTEVSAVDPTQQVSSFELDVCVPATNGGLRCAGDTTALSDSK